MTSFNLKFDHGQTHGYRQVNIRGTNNNFNKCIKHKSFRITNLPPQTQDGFDWRKEKQTSTNFLPSWLKRRNLWELLRNSLLFTWFVLAAAQAFFEDRRVYLSRQLIDKWSRGTLGTSPFITHLQLPQRPTGFLQSSYQFLRFRHIGKKLSRFVSPSAGRNRLCLWR